MKAYKIKSLFFLASFMIAAVVYYNLEQQENYFQSQFTPEQMAELEAEDDSLDQDQLEEELNPYE